MRNRRSDREVGTHQIFGDEEAAQLRADVDSLRDEMASYTDRLQAQFTTIAAHAEIAREQVELARGEARADLDRTRDTVIDLIEQVRSEAATSNHHVAGTAPGASVGDINDRVQQLENRLVELSATIERCFNRQNELADTMAAFLDTVLTEQRSEPVAGLSLA